MMENLTELVKSNLTKTINPPNVSSMSLDNSEETQVEVETKKNEREVDIITFPEWLLSSTLNNGDVKAVKIAIKGVNTDNILIVSYPTGSTLPDGLEEKDVELFKRANRIPALNLPAQTINIYNNSYRMIHNLDDISIKSYGLKTNIILTFCARVEGLLIPIGTTKIKRKQKSIVVPSIPEDVINKITDNLNKECDLEALHLRYKQSLGVEGLTTNIDAIKWLVERQNNITDINHHLQIDQVIMSIALK